MKRRDDQEWVLDACPQLVSLRVSILWDEVDDHDDDHAIIRRMTLELPSLENLFIGRAHTVKTCTLTCPKLVDIEIVWCPKMVALKFDGEAQLHRLKSESRLPSQCIADHKNQVILCVPFKYVSLLIQVKIYR